MLAALKVSGAAAVHMLHWNPTTKFLQAHLWRICHRVLGICQDFLQASRTADKKTPVQLHFLHMETDSSAEAMHRPNPNPKAISDAVGHMLNRASRVQVLAPERWD